VETDSGDAYVDEEGGDTGSGDAYIDEDDSECGESDFNSQPESSPSAVDFTTFHLTDLTKEPPTYTGSGLPETESCIDGNGFLDYSDTDGFEFVKVELTQQPRDEKFSDDFITLEDCTTGLSPVLPSGDSLGESHNDVEQSSSVETDIQMNKIDAPFNSDNNLTSLEIPIEEASVSDISTVGEILMMVG